MTDGLRERLGELADLGELALLSGVEHAALEAFADGRALPDAPHVEAIRRVLPAIEQAALSRHTLPAPTSVAARRGRVPDGYELLLVAARDVREGDLIAYVPPTGRTGSHWVPVDAPPTKQGMMATIAVGGEEVSVDLDAPVRVARPAGSGLT